MLEWRFLSALELLREGESYAVAPATDESGVISLVPDGKQSELELSVLATLAPSSRIEDRLLRFAGLRESEKVCTSSKISGYLGRHIS